MPCAQIADAWAAKRPQGAAHALSSSPCLPVSRSDSLTSVVQASSIRNIVRAGVAATDCAPGVVVKHWPAATSQEDQQ